MDSSNINDALIRSLCNATAYSHNVVSVQLIETHISWVLLTGRYAYKIKKPVNFGFLDFSTLEKRHFFCLEEVRLNKRLADAWYLDVVPITGSANHPSMDGAGAAIEYAVKMRQFPSSETLKEACESGPLTPDTIDQIALLLAQFHQTIEQAEAQSAYGNSRDIKHWSTDNFLHIKPLLNSAPHLRQLQSIEDWSESQSVILQPLMQQRKQRGFVRECHGDLHLGNMISIQGKVTLFDCIEFNPALRWVDVMSEVAFLMMDLLHLGFKHNAYRFLNRYLEQTGDYSGLPLLPYYLVYRAMVRGKVTLLTAAQNPDDEQPLAAYECYVNVAEYFTQAKQQTLIITHGFSGSGKSWIAGQLAESIGAIQIRSDIERKRLFGYSALAKKPESIAGDIYSPEAGQITYQHLAQQANTLLTAGLSVIIDAAFLKIEHRNLFSQLAKQCQVSFIILNVVASTEVLCERVKHRQNDASDATITVLLEQLQSSQPLQDEERLNVIEVNTEHDHALAVLLDKIFNPEAYGSQTIRIKTLDQR